MTLPRERINALRATLQKLDEAYPTVSLFTKGMMIHNHAGGHLAELWPLFLDLWEAALECDNADRHVDVCAMMQGYRPCSCGHDDLAAVLKKLADIKP